MVIQRFTKRTLVFLGLVNPFSALSQKNMYYIFNKTKIIRYRGVVGVSYLRGVLKLEVWFWLALQLFRPLDSLARKPTLENA